MINHRSRLDYTAIDIDETKNDDEAITKTCHSNISESTEEINGSINNHQKGFLFLT